MPTQKRCEQCGIAYTAPKPKRRFCSCRCRAVWVEIVRNIVRAAPGLTSAEVSGHARHFGPLIDRYSAARRLPELEAAGFVRNGEKRRCKVTGRLALTWWPA